MKENKMDDAKKRKIMFMCRVVLWVVALAATIYWIYWSFHLYTLGYVDEHEYAVAFRPIFIKGLFTSLVAVGISFILRIKSDHLKDKYVKNKYDAN